MYNLTNGKIIPFLFYVLMESIGNHKKKKNKITRKIFRNIVHEYRLLIICMFMP